MEILDKNARMFYHYSQLAKLAKLIKLAVIGVVDTRTINSTEAQNNFGRVLDEVVRNRTRYVVRRNGVPQAIIVGFEDFLSSVMGDEIERRRFGEVLKEVRPRYQLGEAINSSHKASTSAEDRKPAAVNVVRTRPNTASRRHPASRLPSDLGQRQDRA